MLYQNLIGYFYFSIIFVALYRCIEVLSSSAKYFFPEEIKKSLANNAYHCILHCLNLKQRSEKRAALMTLFYSGVPNLHVGHIC